MYYERVVDERSYYLFFKGIHDGKSEPHFTPPHCHDAYELLVIKRGSVDGVLNGEPLTLGEGEALFINSYDIHTFLYSDCERYSLVFSREHCRMLSDESETLPSRPTLSDETSRRIISILDAFYSLYGNEIPNGLLVEGIVSTVLGLVESESGRVPRRERSGGVMVEVLEFIRQTWQT